jgi:phage terminase large subunit-like protein
VTADTVDRLALQIPTMQQWVPPLQRNGKGPSAKQLQWCLDPRRAAMFGGAAGGGKSVGQLCSALMFVDQPHYRCLIARETLAELTEPNALIDMAHQWLDDTTASWAKLDRTWTFPSGAKIVFGYLAEHNVQRYLGSQWHAIFLDECTEIDPTAARELRTRLRRVKGDTIPLRFRVSTNPGGTHHAWWKKHYVDRGLLVRSFMSDNPGLDADEYRITLREATTASRFAQLSDGDWDSVAHEGASWDPKDIIYVEAPDPSRIMRYVVGVDTSASASETADECGILLGAELFDGTLVVLEDHSHRARPAAWSAAVSDLSQRFTADVVVEANLSGAAHHSELFAADGAMLDRVHVSGSKQSRHVVTAIRCRRGEVVFAEGLRGGPLVEQMVTWVPPSSGARRRGGSPDRIDALVMLVHLGDGATGLATA